MPQSFSNLAKISRQSRLEAVLESWVPGWPELLSLPQPLQSLRVKFQLIYFLFLAVDLYKSRCFHIEQLYYPLDIK